MKLALLPEGLDGKLVHVIEECAEVQKEACKLQRFGINGFHPRGKKILNKTKLLTEMNQLKLAIKRLEKELTCH